MKILCQLAAALIMTVAMQSGALSNDVFQMEGVAGFVEGRAREVISRAVSENGSAWMAEAIEKVFERGRDGKTGKVDLKKVFYQDAGTRQAVEAHLKEKIRKWLPGAIKEIIIENVFGGAPGSETLNEAQEIAERIAKELDTSLNDRIDQTVGVWYDRTVETLRNKITQAGVPDWVDVTDIKKTIRTAFDLGNISNTVAGQLGNVIGDAAVTGIRARITDALNGNLPPELVHALKKGPDEFDRYVKDVERYLPGNQFERLKNSILNRPLIKLPTPAYASILAASAAGHFARAYDGVFINPYEIRRGIEVTRVMIWQLRNKDFINLSIMQIADIARTVAAGFGAGAAFDGVMSRLKAPLDKLQGELDRIDRMIMKPIKDIQREIKKTVDRIQSELRDIQEKIVSPVRENIDRIKQGTNEAGALIANQIPDTFNGLPGSWEEVKKRAGLEDGVFGEDGNKTPREMLKDAAKDLGLDEVGRKIKKDFSDVGEAIAGKIAKGAAGGIEAAHLLGPAAAIMEVDRRPAEDESKSREMDPVLLHSGEFEHSVTDVVIPGRGIDYKFTRTYRSGAAFMDELGTGWTHSYAERLLPWNDGEGGGLTYIDESGRKFFFRMENDVFTPPRGMHSAIVQVQDGYRKNEDDGMVTEFDSGGRPVRKSDRYGNAIKYIYNDAGLVAAIEDVFGRRIEFVRRPDGLISKTRDFAGRTFTYTYNDERELIGVTTPAVPDFPKGKTTAYRYEIKNDHHLMTFVMDPNGRAYLKNRYDEEGRVAGQSYGEGPWMTAVYRAGDGDIGSRAWVTDAMGVMRLYENDVEGRLLRLWRYDAGGYHLIEDNGYDADGESGAGAAGEGGEKKEAAKINAAGQIVSEEDSAGLVTSYEYYLFCDPDGDGVMTSGCQDDGRGGGYLRRVGRNNLARTFEYDPIGNITKITGPGGVVSAFSVNALNQITKEESAPSPVRRYYFDANDNLKKAVVGKAVHEFEYDVLDRRKKVRLQVAAGRHIETRYDYDAVGNLIRVTHPEGNADDYEYDTEGRLLCTVRGSNTVQRSAECVERDTQGRIEAFVDPEGLRTNFERDGRGRIVAARDPAGSRSEFERDPGGNIISRRDFDLTAKLLAETKYEYDGGGRPVKILRRLWRDDPRVSRWVEEGLVYGDSENAKQETGDRKKYTKNRNQDVERDKVEIKSDYLGRPVEVIRDPTGLKIATKYEWNGNGLLVKVTDPLGKETKFTYDGLDRLASEERPDGTVRNYEYDRRGLVTQVKRSDGQVMKMKYDAAGRLVERNAPSMSQRFAYDGLGRLLFAIDRGGAPYDSGGVVSRFVYDSLSRPLAEETGGAWLRREYDDGGHVVSMVLPSGRTFYYFYDSNGRPGSVVHDGKGLGSFDYDANGQNVSQRLGENLRLEVARDPMGLELKRSYMKNTGERLAGSEYFYDDTGLLAHESSYAGPIRAYRRDAAGRLVEASEFDGQGARGNSARRKWSYIYDAAGNIKNPGEALALDANGDTASNGRNEFRYDDMGRLVGIFADGRPVAQYLYDAFDRRVMKIVNGKIGKAVWNGWQLVEEEKGDENYVSYVHAAGLVPFAVVKGSEVSYLFTDRLGSVVAAAEAGGKISSRCSYDPYGQKIPAAPSGEVLPHAAGGFADCAGYDLAFGFAGQVADNESGLVYMRERYYDPKLGRFLTPDPLGFKMTTEITGGVSVAPALSYHEMQGGASRATHPNRSHPFNRVFVDDIPFESGETNLYLYARADPSSFTDPLGLASIVFDRSDQSITLRDRNGTAIESYDAANLTTRPGADPFEIGARGPFPNGTYSIGIPEFYSDEYRRYVISKYELGDIAPRDAVANGEAWVKNSADRKNYSLPFGRIRIRAGSYGKEEEDAVVAMRGLFLHGGRMNFKARTHGCIRVDDRDIERLAVEFLNLQRDGDPINAITVQD